MTDTAAQQTEAPDAVESGYDLDYTRALYDRLGPPLARLAALHPRLALLCTAGLAGIPDPAGLFPASPLSLNPPAASRPVRRPCPRPPPGLASVR